MSSCYQNSEKVISCFIITTSLGFFLSSDTNFVIVSNLPVQKKLIHHLEIFEKRDY